VKACNLLILFVVTLLTSGCIDTGDDSGSDSSSTWLDSFAVSSDREEGGTSVVAPNEEFQISWEGSGGVSPTWVEIYATHNSDVVDTDSVEIFSGQCDALDITPCQSDSGQLECFFDGDNTVDCGPYDEGDLTEFFPELPYGAHLTIEICDGLMRDCKLGSAPIRFE